MTQRFVLVIVSLAYALAITIGTWTGGLWAACGLGVGGVVFITALFNRTLKTSVSPSWGVFLLATLIIMAGACVVQDAVGNPWPTYARLVSIFVPLLFLTSPALSDVGRRFDAAPLLAAGIIIGSGTLAVELMGEGVLLHALKGIGAGVAKYNRGVSYMALLAVPVFGGLWITERRHLAWFLVIVVLVSLLFVESRAAKVALSLSVFVTLGAIVFPQGARFVLGGCAVLAAGWPTYAAWLYSHHHAVVMRLPDSWHHRVEIWDYLSYRLAEHRWLGWGVGQSQKLPTNPPHGAEYVFATTPAPHPHNAVIQAWGELGVGGLVLFIGFLLMLLHGVKSLSPRLRPFAYGAWAGGFALLLCAYNLWTDSLFAMIALVALAFRLVDVHVEKVTSGKQSYGAGNVPAP